jgi:putative transposase
MKVNNGIKIRLKPNASQRQLLEKQFGCNRFLWNYFLNKRRRDYQQTKKGSTYGKDAAALIALKHDGVHDWLNEASITSLQRTLKHLDNAYKLFFKGHARFPRFKSKKHEQSFTLAGVIRIKDKRLIVPKFQEGIKFHRDLPAFTKIRNVTIRRVASGKYYACLSVESEKAALPKTGKEAGIDLGLKDFAVFSNGARIKPPKRSRKQQAALRRARNHLSRKQQGSKRKEAQGKKLAKIHEKIANSRKDFLHKASAFAIRNFDTICIEDLSVENMLRNRALAKSIADAGWGQFVSYLSYKAKWYGRTLVKVGRFYPSSKTCGSCGSINQELTLADRKWACPSCGATHDRDLNSAVNILREGKRQFGAVIPENRRRGNVRPKQARLAGAVSGEASNPFISKG